MDQIYISGTAPVIVASPETKYLCDTINSLSFTPCQSGECSVRFTSGNNATLTIPDTVSMPDYWTGPKASATYEITVKDGVYGSIKSWNDDSLEKNVRYDIAQTLTDAEKTQVKANVDAASVSDVVALTDISDDYNYEIYNKLLPQAEYWGPTKRNDSYYGLSINRVRKRIYIDGTATSRIRIKMSGVYARTDGNGALNSWTCSIPMEANAEYKLTATVVSGSVPDSMGVYVRDSAGADKISITSVTTKGEAIAKWSSGNGKIYVLCPLNSVYDKAVVEITLVKTADEGVVNTVKRLDMNVPDYYANHIADKALEFTMAQHDVIDNNIRFAFITDTHLRNADGTLMNACNSPALLKYLCDNANLGMIVFGGDAITGSYASQNAAMKDIMFFRRVFSSVWDKMYCIFGNHEYGNNSSSIEPLSMYRIYGVMEQDKEMKYKAIEQGHNTGSYVIDNDVKKVRMIFINLNNGTNIHPQVNFFTSQLQSMPSGYTAVIFTHFTIYRTDGVDAIDQKLTREDSIVPVVNAYMNRGTYKGVDFSNCDGSVAAIIGGHCHFDSMVKTETGVPVISTTCDKFNTAADGYDRTPGTVGEQAFDLYTINTSSKTIDIIRVGAGNNRSFTYGSLPEN